MLFDTHAHYDSGAFNADRIEVLSSMPEQGVGLILNPGCELDSSRAAVALAEAFPFVYAAVGFHPSDCEGYSDQAEAELRSLAAQAVFRKAGDGRSEKVHGYALEYLCLLRALCQYRRL